MSGFPDMTAPALVFRTVTSGYRNRPVLEGVGFSIAEGEFVSVIGPNGSGKSTMLRTATGLLRPRHGRVELFGREISTLKPRERASLIGVVPQKLESPMAFTVGEIVAFGRSATRGRWGVPDPKRADAAERAMIYTGVLELKERLFIELSAGEQQRAALAMALAQEPRIIMLDESIAHLDINHSQEVLRILMNINREEKMTVLLVSHDLNLAAQVADRMLLMAGGRLVANGSPGEVMREELLSRVYGCELRVRPDPYGGHPVVGGMLDAVTRRSGRRKRLHVVCGGGSGIELFRRLLIEGYEVTAGALNRLDSDAEAARALDIPCALEQPFSPLGPGACEEARMMLEQADGLVVGAVPFGPGNLVNLRLASMALDSGKPVWMAADILHRDYTPAHDAARLADSLRSAGAVEWSEIHELMALLQQGAPHHEA